jgi:hypothetical protein
MASVTERLRYRVLTGPDDAEFCRRVSSALDEGYELHGSPAITHDGTQTIVAQAVVLPPYAAASFRPSAISADPVPDPVLEATTAADPFVASADPVVAADPVVEAVNPAPRRPQPRPSGAVDEPVTPPRHAADS